MEKESPGEAVGVVCRLEGKVQVVQRRKMTKCDENAVVGEECRDQVGKNGDVLKGRLQT